MVTLKVKDYLQNGRQALIRLHEKGGEEKDIPCHHLLEGYLDSYIAAAGIANDKRSRCSGARSAGSDGWE